MAKLIMTHSRDDVSKPWVYDSRENAVSGMFTPQENIILKSTVVGITSLPGWISTENSFPDNNTHVITLNFDTLEHAEAASESFQSPVEGSLLDIRKKFLLQKRESLGITYTTTYSVTE
jgi:hypothetical protein